MFYQRQGNIVQCFGVFATATFASGNCSATITVPITSGITLSTSNTAGVCTSNLALTSSGNVSGVSTTLVQLNFPGNTSSAAGFVYVSFAYRLS